jgi:hypothetical protein
VAIDIGQQPPVLRYQRSEVAAGGQLVLKPALVGVPGRRIRSADSDDLLDPAAHGLT